MDKEILEYIKYGGWILFGSGIVFEFSPIKFNPISTVLSWLGKKLNKDVEKKVAQVETKVDMMQTDLQNHKVESWRRDILAFSDSLSLGKNKSKEQYLYIFSIHDNYEKYIIDRGLINGQINVAFDYITKRYNECLENNSFYTGK